MDSADIRDLCGLALFLFFDFGVICLLLLSGDTEKNNESKKEAEVIFQPYFSNRLNSEID